MYSANRQHCGRIGSCHARRRTVIHRRRLGMGAARITLRARQRDAQTFSMLIDSVHARLCGDGADSVLADSLFKAFPAALIDEFQDTDQRQFEIFDRIFRDVDGVPRGSLTMIGDPKQAIFGFRGGDIAAYLRASQQATLFAGDQSSVQHVLVGASTRCTAIPMVASGTRTFTISQCRRKAGWMRSLTRELVSRLLRRCRSIVFAATRKMQRESHLKRSASLSRWHSRIAPIASRNC